MAVPFIRTSFVTGELAPSVFGHVDLAKFPISASTMRNLFVSYRGGAYSRAGTKFVGFSKQTGRAYPPRLIPFQFSINQGLALEFGNLYMRVVANGAFVTDESFAITGATNANPCVVTASAQGASVVVQDNSAVTVSYAPGDKVSFAGGTFSTRGQITVTSTQVLSLLLRSAGAGVYAPADTITLAGGTPGTKAVVTVATTTVVGTPTIVAAGSGGTPGTAVVTGTTGTGTRFQANVTIGGGGVISSVDSLVTGGSYTVNPSAPANEPVTGGSLTGARLGLAVGVLTFTLTNAGVYTTNPVGGIFTQGSTSGSGTGATFQTALMGIHALTISTPGVYASVPANEVQQFTTTGIGQGAAFTVTWATVAPFADGDWVEIDGVLGMTQLNGRTFVVAGASGTTFQLNDVYGDPIDATAYGVYTSGGEAARIFTLTTPWAEADLPWLKYTESADVMSLTCWNQDTGTSYPPYDLARLADNNWTITAPKFSASIGAPGTLTLETTMAGDAAYDYVVTAVSKADGSESVASPVATVASIDIAVTAGTITSTWSPVEGASTYNIYRAPVSVSGGTVPVGSLFGYVGTAYGTQFADSNITPDFGQVPPIHEDPFAVGQIIGAPVTAAGSGYDQASATYTISTVDGTGAVLAPVIVDGALSAIIVVDPGEGYAPGDTVAIGGGMGVGATATLTIGAETGTWPSVVAYYQQRRVYAASPNNPDTYWMSQPGSFSNFDSRIPTIDSDAITGSPWSVQVNGIQFMVPMPGGLVVLTGQGAWQVTGQGGSSQNPVPITPASQQAQPQAFNGISPRIPPIKINYDILYVQAKGSIWRDLSYNYWINIYTGADLTELSSHLFTDFTMIEAAYCEEPFKIVWVVRSDGALLSLTYLKEQEVQGWARHDTNGLFVSVCSVTEPPVDALYLATQRFPGTHTAYMVERMDNRIGWTAESAWCVDCGLQLPMPAPAATLVASSATGLGSITGVTGLIGGSGYSAATTASVVDNDGKGPGTGAVPTLTIVAGVITAITFSGGQQGTGYVQPRIDIYDPANQGRGASALAVLNNHATFTASAAVFGMGNIGSVIRMGGGIATITAYTDTEHVTANITSPITTLLPNSGGKPLPAQSGAWTLTAPVTMISGLDYLAGATVTGLADGNVVTPRVVSVDGTITLDTAASAVTLGLGFQAQIQSTYLDTGSPTGQGQRKRTAEATARLETSRGVTMGGNQPDGSTLSPAQLAPVWSDMAAIPDTDQYDTLASKKPYNSNFQPLYTGDRRIPVIAGFNRGGQVALQQDNPLPLQLLALIPEVDEGDVPQPPGPAREPPQQQRGSR